MIDSGRLAPGIEMTTGAARHARRRRAVIAVTLPRKRHNIRIRGG